MPNIAAMFRQEIIRLARREIRSQTQVLRKASAQFRRDIAGLKREASRLSSEVARLQRRASRDVEPGIAGAQSPGGRYSARSVIAQRKRLGLTAVDFGRLAGVTDQSVFNWERGTSHPRAEQINALVSLRTVGKRAAIRRLEELRKKNPKKRTGRG